MDSDIKIRIAVAEDAKELLAIYAPYVEKTAITFEYEVPSAEEFADRIRHVLKKYPYLAAESGGEMIGYAYADAFKERAAYAWSVETSVYVRADRKKQGVGRLLYEALEQILKRQGILNLNACIAYPEEEDEYLSKDSVLFHDRMGYRMVGEFRQCGYKFNRWYNMVWMEKQIGEHIEGQPFVKTFEEIRTDRKTEVPMQKEKEQLEKYFQTLIKQLPGGVAVVSYGRDGKMVPEYLSDGFAAMTGMTPKEAYRLYRKDALTGVHPDDRKTVTDRMARFVNSKESSCELIYRLQKGNGEYLWVKNSLSMIQSENGEGKIYANYNDITKELEERKKLRQQYDDLLRQHYRTPGPNALIVGHCNITKNRILEIIDYTDSGLLAAFGTDREMFFRGLAGLVVNDKERKAFLNNFLNAPSLEAFRRKDTVLTLDCFIKLPAKSHGCYVQFKISLVEMPDTGDITGILTVTDTTEQVLSERIMRLLSVVSCDLVADVDLLQNRYRLLNGNLASTDGQAQEGRHSDRVTHMLQKQVVEGDRKQVERMLDPAYIMERLQRESAYSFHYSMMGGDEEISTKKLTVSAIDLRLGRVCLARADVTDVLEKERLAQKTLENALALAEEASRAKSEFLSSMSHDIRTPLNAIMGMTTLATANIGDPVRVADSLQKISLSSRHLLSLINDILDMSKIESGKITLNRMEMSVTGLISQLSGIIEQQASSAGLQFHAASEKIRHEYFYGDALRLNQVLLNLLGNAVKFTPKGGSVEFKVEELAAADRPGFAHYRFTVRDTGIGMTEDFLARLFEPFSRSREAARIEGTGLGLSISKGLVELMGGTIRVESRPGAGTAFFLEVQCEAAKDCAASRVEKENINRITDSQNSLLLGRRILVAEDNEINAEILCGVLKLYGAKTTVGWDGTEAVREFQNTPQGTYDAILMDIRMPEMNGYDATRAIRALDRTDAKTIPIIAMSANAFAEDVQEALASGMNAHIAKPIDLKVLEDTLIAILP